MFGVMRKLMYNHLINHHPPPFNPLRRVLFLSTPCVNILVFGLRKDENDMANPNPIMKFSAEYQPAGRGLSYRNRLIEALKRCGMGEEEFLDAFIRTSIRMVEENPTQGVQMLKEIFLRISPMQKTMAPPVEFKYQKGATPVQQIEDVIQSVSLGELPIDVASQVVSMIKVGLDVKELTELAERLEKLERLMEQQNG